MKKYFPILLSRRGEIGALQFLSQKTKENISPIIEVVDDSLEKKIKVDSAYKIIYKDELELFLKTHWNFWGNEVILDFSLVSNIDSKIGLIENMLISLLNSNVNIILAVQVNSSSVYADLVYKLYQSHNVNICLRTSENSGGFDYFEFAIEKLLQNAMINVKRIILLLDLGFLQIDRINSIKDLAKAKLKQLPIKITDWYHVVLASSSFPSNLGECKSSIVPNILPRLEWEIWKSIQSDEDLKTLRYSDFGVKYPYYIEANFAGTISIKYTTENHFIIYKGEKTEEHKDGHGQYISHSQKLVSSDFYYGEDYSWGDMRIKQIADQAIEDEKRKTGSTTTWVQISQNHHITLIEMLL